MIFDRVLVWPSQQTQRRHPPSTAEPYIASQSYGSAYVCFLEGSFFEGADGGKRTLLCGQPAFALDLLNSYGSRGEGDQKQV